MTLSVAELDALPESEAEEVFRFCCGSSQWIHGMIARRPFGSVERVLTAADSVWQETSPEDWHEAFTHHPRIGEKGAAKEQDTRASEWSEGEQAGVRTISAEMGTELAEANRAYEERFGHIYIVCANGRSGEEMLAMARERLANDPQTELRVAAEQQRRITDLRLRKLLGADT
ncbi:MAG: 2-oxo-4-hydroxy-4-carboxy-5-ureidoimidazoline decarboxylase [Gemmatimonadales bacterium]